MKCKYVQKAHFVELYTSLTTLQWVTYQFVLSQKKALNFLIKVLYSKKK